MDGSGVACGDRRNRGRRCAGRTAVRGGKSAGEPGSGSAEQSAEGPLESVEHRCRCDEKVVRRRGAAGECDFGGRCAGDECAGAEIPDSGCAGWKLRFESAGHPYRRDFSGRREELDKENRPRHGFLESRPESRRGGRAADRRGLPGPERGRGSLYRLFHTDTRRRAEYGTEKRRFRGFASRQGSGGLDALDA